MKSVVLNTEQKDSIVQAVTSFKQFKEYVASSCHDVARTYSQVLT